MLIDSGEELDRFDRSLLDDLSRFQRILLITDGTVTELLEHYLEERIEIHKILECVEEDSTRIHARHGRFTQGYSGAILKREVLLRGQRTGKNWLYAQSTILLEHLDDAFREDLLRTKTPIGKLWKKHRSETFKAILELDRHPAQEVAQHFGIAPSAPLITRSYSVQSNRRPVMLISEHFPLDFFHY
jgi:chorismate-pyruvate lyase